MAQEQIKREDVQSFVVVPEVFDAMLAALNELPAKHVRGLLNEVERTTRIIKKAKVEDSDKAVVGGGDTAVPDVG